LLVAALGGLLYVNTLGHQYTLDDIGIIPGNAITRQGLVAVPTIFKTDYWAGLPGTFGSHPLYRPLSKAMFAVEWDLDPNRPALGHGVNVVLYGLTGFLLFVMLRQYSRGRLLLPFVAAVLFVAHPIHTEAVANIKSRDEILCFLFFVLTSMATHRYATRGSPLFLSLGGVSFFLSLLSKESAVTFLAAIPLMLFFYTDSPRSRTAASLGVLGLVTGVFLYMRHAVLEHTMSAPVALVENYLVGLTDVSTRTTTAVYLLGVYLKRLIFPYPLISDGSYHHFPVVAASDWGFLLAFGACAALMLYAVRGLKKKDPVSFGILYFFVTASIVSNVFVIIGTNYAERLMYAPSLGVCLAVGALLVRGFGADEAAVTPSTAPAFFRAHRGPLLALALVTALCGLKTLTRNADWYDNRTLFARDVRLAPGSARLHFARALEFIKQAERRTGQADNASGREDLAHAVEELDKALEIHPQYGRALAGLARAYQAMNQGDKAQGYHEMALRVEPTAELHNNYGAFLFRRGDLERAIEQYQLAVRASPAFAAAHTNLGLAYARLGDRFVNAASGADGQKNEKDSQRLVSAARENFQAAVSHLEQALATDPSDPYAHQVLGAIYELMEDGSKARYYLDRAAQLRRRLSP
jgi:Tfp pilus assembly protein PilF